MALCLNCKSGLQLVWMKSLVIIYRKGVLCMCVSVHAYVCVQECHLVLSLNNRLKVNVI